MEIVPSSARRFVVHRISPCRSVTEVRPWTVDRDRGPWTVDRDRDRDRDRASSRRAAVREERAATEDLTKRS
jgi:hypothetical protein